MPLYSSTQAALADFEQVINTLSQELEIYARRPQPSLPYIDKQNRHIQHLTQIYNGIAALQHYDVWQRLETTMQHLTQQDPNICGHTIRLRTKPTGDNFSLIDYNPFNP